jgi:hypothetical protein
MAVGMPRPDRSPPRPPWAATLPVVPGEVCLVNEFDPAWGEPPPAYQGVPMRFDPDMGAYEWDLLHAMERLPKREGWATNQSFWMDRIPALYQQNYMIQPFKPAGSDAWKFRQIVRKKNVVCASAPGSDRTAPPPSPFRGMPIGG